MTTDIRQFDPLKAQADQSRTRLGGTLTCLAMLLVSTGIEAQSAPVPAAPAAPAPPQVDRAAEVAEAQRAEAYGQHRSDRDLHRISRVLNEQSQMEAIEAYKAALQASEAEQQAALDAVRSAREQLQAEASALAAMREREESLSAGELGRMEEERQRELSRIQQELERAHDNLRRASREVAGVHRNISRPPRPPRPNATPAPPRPPGSSRGVIGVILGNDIDGGVEVLGVSPDGPAERAGLKTGDVIVSVMDAPLDDGDGPVRAVATQALRDIQPGDEIKLDVRRAGKEREFVVVAGKSSEPFTWHSTSRITTVTSDGSAPVVIERIELPELDRESLVSEIENLKEDLERRIITVDVHGPYLHEDEFEFNFESFSEAGESVLAGTNLWFGMSLTRGVKMTELEGSLGDYFGVSEGVLILKAAADNELELEAGDIILEVNDAQVSRPADVMRALRSAQAGSELTLDIKRQKQDQQITVTVPENRLGMHFQGDYPLLLEGGTQGAVLQFHRPQQD